MYNDKNCLLHLKMFVTQSVYRNVGNVPKEAEKYLRGRKYKLNREEGEFCVCKKYKPYKVKEKRQNEIPAREIIIKMELLMTTVIIKIFPAQLELVHKVKVDISSILSSSKPSSVCVYI